MSEIEERPNLDGRTLAKFRILASSKSGHPDDPRDMLHPHNKIAAPPGACKG